jgi:NAD(P)-dependent dehydrogenase (short-subunit alcohol dehydrogenase family)
MSTRELFSVAGKTAVVTGGSRGVGLMIARGFVEAGAKVYIASRSASVCDEVAAELTALPGEGECVSLPADVSTREGCRALAAAVKEREPALHILVNNAGIEGPVSVRRNNPDAWDEVLAVNLKGVFHCTYSFLPLLKKASGEDDPARVINIGSLTGRRTMNMEAFAYSSSKAGMHFLTASMARRLAPDVTVNAVALGPFESKMTENMLTFFRGVAVANSPLKRIGRPDDVAGAARFLASRAGQYLTGAVIPVDGGLSTSATT